MHFKTLELSSRVLIATLLLVCHVNHDHIGVVDPIGKFRLQNLIVNH